MKYLLVGLLGIAMGVQAQEIRLTQIVSGVASPTDIESADDGTGRLFLVQQNGIVRIYQNGALAAAPFLDISAKTKADGERGLLGLALPPGFAASQRFYVDYTDLNGDTIIAQYQVSSDPNRADPLSETVLLKIAQPYANHNGGQVRFGPDGYLYVRGATRSGTRRTGSRCWVRFCG
jgi:glucose/arabinose dehydrogenase